MKGEIQEMNDQMQHMNQNILQLMTDMKTIQTDMKTMQSDMKTMQTDMKTMKSDMQGMRNELKGEIQGQVQGLRTELKAEIHQVFKIVVSEQALNAHRYSELKGSIDDIYSKMATKEQLDEFYFSLSRDIVDLSNDYYKFKKRVSPLLKKSLPKA